MDTIPKLIQEDEILGAILPKIKLDNSPSQTLDIEQALIKSIVGQQLSVKAAATIYDRFLNLFQGQPTGAAILALEDEALRQVGLSRMKASYVKNVARFFEQEDSRQLIALPDDHLIEKLVSIKGVGEWTVQMVLMFYLGKPDIFPTKDLGIQIAMCELFTIDRGDKKIQEKMNKIALRWKPHRTCASLILWKYKDLLLVQKNT